MPTIFIHCFSSLFGETLEYNSKKLNSFLNGEFSSMGILPDGDIVTKTEKEIQIYERNGNLKRSLSYPFTGDIILTDQSGIWFGSFGEGLTRYHLNSNLSSSRVISALSLKDDLIWFGTWRIDQGVGGISIFNGRKFLDPLTTESGLAYDVVFNMVEDLEGKIWVATYGGGVSIYKNKVWSSIDIRDGLPTNDIFSIDVSPRNEIWIAANKKIVKYKASQTKPKVIIKSVRYGSVIKHYPSNKLKLKTGQRLSIISQSIDYKTHPEKQQYQYKVHSQYLDWLAPIRSEHFEHVFDKIGSYIFEVRAIDRDLNYSVPVRLPIEVIPVWYMNGWVIFPCSSAILVLLFLAIVNGIRYYQQRRESERLELEAQQLQSQMFDQERKTRLALETELADAHQMQLSLLPESAPSTAGLQIAGRNIAAKEVGGDFFDYLETEGQLTIAVGDVSGKGLKGAMNAVMTSGILRLASDENPTSDNSVLMSKVNKSLCHSMEQDMNVTMVLAQFDLPQKQMILANAGQHAYPLLKRGNSVEPVKAKGLALGMIPSIDYRPLIVDLQPGDLLLFMTDGITEPRNAEGLMYEESGRFHKVISELSDKLSAEEVVESIIQDVINYMVDEEERDDDITLVAVKVT